MNNDDERDSAEERFNAATMREELEEEQENLLEARRGEVAASVTAASEAGVHHGYIRADVEAVLSVLSDPGVYYKIHFSDTFDPSQSGDFPAQYATAEEAEKDIESSWAECVANAEKGMVGPLVWSKSHGNAQAVGDYALGHRMTGRSTYTVIGPLHKEDDK